MSADPQTTFRPRPVRVSVPVRVEFRGTRFAIREFTANLSQGGLFLLTEHMVPPGTHGRLTFRVTPWDPPFTLDAEVVRVVLPGGPETDRPAGLGIRFAGIPDADRVRLQRLVDGVRDGSVIESIRRSIRESSHGLDHELRHRTPDQKMILAIGAQGEEIDALIRDGNPSVMQRLLDNPRLRIQHVRVVMRDPRAPARVLLDIKRQQQWFRDEEVRWAYCRHPKAAFMDVQHVLSTLSVPRLQQIAADGLVRMNVRNKAREIVHRKART